MIAHEHKASLLALRYRLLFLSFWFRYLVWLFWIGVATTFTMAALLLYESVAVTLRLLIE